MNFYRLLGAMSKEVNLTKVTEAFGNYAKKVKLPSFKVPSVKASGGVVSIGADTLASLEKRVKLGYVADTMRKVYKIEKLPSSIELKLIDEVKHLPSYKVGVSKRAADTLEANIGAVGSNVTESTVAANSRLSKVIDYLKGKSFISITGGTVVIGVTTVYALQAIQRHRDMMSGCFRYEMVRGKIEACKVQSCSCVNGAPSQGGSNYCAADKLPADMLVTSGCSGSSGTVCVNCPSASFESDKGDVTSDDGLSNPAPNDNVYYECRNATFWEAVSDLVGDEVDKVIDIGTSVATEVGSALALLLKVLKYGAAVVGICGVIGAIAWIYFRVNKNAGEFDDDRIINDREF